MPGFIRSIRFSVLAVVLISAPSIVASTTHTHLRLDTNAATSGPDDPCSLLTREDAAAALGEAVSAPKTKTMANAGGPGVTVSYCEYTGSGYNRIQLNLTRIAASSAPMYRAMCQEKATKDLTGLGDVACWYNEKHEELHALKGTAFLSLEIKRSGDPTEAIKGAMKQALERLK